MLKRERCDQRKAMRHTDAALVAVTESVGQSVGLFEMIAVWMASLR